MQKNRKREETRLTIRNWFLRKSALVERTSLYSNVAPNVLREHLQTSTGWKVHCLASTASSISRTENQNCTSAKNRSGSVFGRAGAALCLLRHHTQ